MVYSHPKGMKFIQKDLFSTLIFLVNQWNNLMYVTVAVTLENSFISCCSRLLSKHFCLKPFTPKDSLS